VAASDKALLWVTCAWARQAARDLPAPVREQLPEIDWPAWAALPDALIRPSEHPLKIWVAARELTPRTVQQLINYRRVHPELFSMVP
jgi:hypothetical protein